MQPLKSLSKSGRTYRAFALVIVLAFVVLLSGIIVAFFSRAITERQVSNSSMSEVQADILAHSAADLIVGGLKQEIKVRSNPLVSGTVTVYQPLTAADMLPVRSGTPALASGTDQIPNLVRRSMYAATDPAALTGSASNVSTSGTSSNGRWIKTARWNEHYLIPRANGTATNDYTPVSAFTAPDWVFLTGTGPGVLTSPSKAVIGRYSYVIYNEGGLLDINVAGYPSSLPSAASPFPIATSGSYGDWGYSRKGGVAFADLTQLPFAGGTFTQAQINSIVGWRNYGTAQPAGTLVGGYTFDQTSAAKYFDAVVSASTGFLTVTSSSSARTDQRFTSRQMLLKFWRDMGFNENALQYFTTFSREKNAPSWEPLYNASVLSGTDNGMDLSGKPIAGYYAYKDNADSASAVNRRLYNVRVASRFQRLDGTWANPGDPLIKYRFDLNKLGWIRYDGSLPGGVAAIDIYNYFGLTRNPDGSWSYNHGLPANGERINTLDEVASAGREPDFFELLQAGILRGSLGLCSGDPTKSTDVNNGGEFYRIANLDTKNTSLVRRDDAGPIYAQEKYQIIQIGANIIDQADSDSYPTEIILNGESFYGIENLPYINALGDAALRPAPGGAIAPNDYQAYVHRWLTFGLWNPHQNAATINPVGPSQFQIYVDRGSQMPYLTNTPRNNKYPASGAASTTGTSLWFDFGDTPEWVRFNSSDYNGFAEPSTLKTGSATVSDPRGSIVSSSSWQRVGIYTGWSYSPDISSKVPLCGTNPTISGSDAPLSALYTYAMMNISAPLTIHLQYKDASGKWRSYQELFGTVYPRDGRGEPYFDTNDPAWGQIDTATYPKPRPGDEAWDISFLDPRCIRQNMPARAFQMMVSVNGNNVKRKYYNTAESYFSEICDTSRAQGPHFITPTSCSMELWISNSSSRLTGYTDATDTIYTDRDYVRRIGDVAGWGTKTSATGTMSSPLARNDSSYAEPLKRPLILDRPFRSVGELGFVFRDDPWKSLNFFTPSSPYAVTSGTYSTSADAALLDLFCVGSTSGANVPQPSVVEGKVNINSAPPAVLQTIVANALLNYPSYPGVSPTLSGTDLISGTNCLAIANDIYKQTHPTVTGSAPGPFFTIAEVPCILSGTNGKYPPNKMQRESVIRALGDSCGTRTWNLLIDIIAQSGKFASNAKKLDNFVVEGEKHYWLHVAIDRYTGEIVDQQFELVSE